jgi:hypothetical protein
VEDGRAADLRDHLVVVPGARVGRRLEELLVEESAHRGLRLVPPRILTLAGAQEAIANVEGVFSTPAEDLLAWARALREVARRDLEVVFPNAPQEHDSPQWLELARICIRLHRMVGAEGLTFRDVGHRCGRFPDFDDNGRWAALSGIQHEAIALLRKAGRLDRESALDAAAHRRSVRTCERVWVVGVTELSRTARRLLDSLPQDSVRVLIAAPEDRASWFDPWGCPREDAWTQVRLSLEDRQIRVVDRPRDQGVAVAEILREIGSEFSADEVVIGAPDPAIVPFVESELREAGVESRYAGGRRVRGTGPFLLLESVAEYLETRSFPALATLVRHPAFQTGFGDEPVLRDAPAILDRYHERHLPARVGERVPGKGREARLFRDLLGRLAAEDLLGPLAGRKPLPHWSAVVLDLLAGIYGRCGYDLTTPGGRQILASLQALRRAALALAELPTFLVSSASAPAAIRLLLFLCREETLPPQPAEDAVEILGWLENPLDDSPALILCGVNEPSLPESVGGDAFLPNRLRHQLGLPTDATRLARDLFHMEGVLNARKVVRVVAGRRGAEGDPLQPSRLLFAAEPGVAARRILRLLRRDGEGEVPPPIGSASDGVSPSSVAASETGPSMWASPPEPTLRFDPPEVLNVTDFGRILRDPYQWVLERRLGLKALQDGDRELTPLGFGSLAHRVLERFGRDPEATEETDAVRLASILDGILDRLATEEFADLARPAVAIQVEHLRIRLRGFARWQSRWRSDGWRIVGTEMQPGGATPAVPLGVGGESILLAGRIDRIDRNERTGRWAVFDYKTSASPRTPDEVHRGKPGGEWRDLQLPLYRHILPFLMGPDGGPLLGSVAPDRIDLGYVLLPRDPERVQAPLATGEGGAGWTDEDFASADETAARVIRFARSGEVQFDPDSRKAHRGQPTAPLVGALELFGDDAPESGTEDGR